MNSFKNTPIIIKDPNYETRLKKLSHRQRKEATICPKYKSVKLPCLEHGNAAVVFELLYSKQLSQDLELWWEYEYIQKGEHFNVELVTDERGVIELRYMLNKPFYKPHRMKLGKRFQSVQDSLEQSVEEVYKTLPHFVQGELEAIVVSDWDYLEYVDEQV